MNIFLTIILIVIAFIILVQILMYLKMKAKKGKLLDIEKLPDNLKSLIKKDKSMIYFYSPKCSVCKMQEPIINDLKKEIKNLVSYNVLDNFSVAREFGIMATPATVIIKNGMIEQILIGLKNKEELLKSFNKK